VALGEQNILPATDGPTQPWRWGTQARPDSPAKDNIHHAQVITFIDIAFVDLADLPDVNALYAELFPEGLRPARTIYQAAALPFGGRVKVMGVAVRESQERVLG